MTLGDALWSLDTGSARSPYLTLDVIIWIIYVEDVTMTDKDQRLAVLLAHGFDRSTRCGRAITVQCSQCVAAVINGIACHETGCPNQRHECKGCNATVARKGAYCEDCQ